MVAGELGTGLEVDTGTDLFSEAFSLVSLTVTVDDFLLPAETVKEAKENIARKKLLRRMKRVIKKIYDTILPKR